MTKVSISPAEPHDLETCAGGGSAAPGVARWLGLAAAPTFAIMALWTGFFSGDARLIADERNDGDVSADERLPRSAMAEVDLQPTSGVYQPTW